MATWLRRRLASSDVDRAPVGQAGHDQLRDAPQRLLVVQRGGERHAGLGEEALAQLGLLGLGHVLDHADRHQLAVGPRSGAALTRRQRCSPVSRCTIRVSIGSAG